MCVKDNATRGVDFVAPKSILMKFILVERKKTKIFTCSVSKPAIIFITFCDNIPKTLILIKYFLILDTNFTKKMH